MRYQTRSIILNDEADWGRALRMLQNAPTGIEIVAREPVRARKPDQNSLYWAGPLKDIAAQVWIEGRAYSDVVWHEHLKGQYLPEADDPDLAELVRKPETWRKWDETPGGRRVLAGSTTDLTVKGFARYLEQVYAFGAEHGVRFGMREAA